MKALTVVRAGLYAALIALLTCTASFADDWSGNYETTGTKGDPFSISLTSDGKAKGDMKGTPISGTWTAEDGNAAEIAWETGWTTSLSKDGDGYKKSAYSPGAAKSDGPTHTASAKKVN